MDIAEMGQGGEFMDIAEMGQGGEFMDIAERGQGASSGLKLDWQDCCNRFPW
jgi:hypothetical protein